MSRLQHDTAMAALARMADSLTVPDFLGTDKELTQQCERTLQTIGVSRFANITNIKERLKIGDYTGLVFFSANGIRKTLGRHALYKAAYLADLYRIFILDKFIKPRVSPTIPLVLNLEWTTDQLDHLDQWMAGHNDSVLFIEAWLAWMKSNNCLHRVGIHHNLTDEEREKAREARYARRSQFGALSLQYLKQSEQLVEGTKATMSVLAQGVSEIMTNTANTDTRLETLDTRLAKIESLLAAICKVVVALPLAGGEDYTSPPAPGVCLLCKVNKAEPGQDHCGKCQPLLTTSLGGAKI